jgi:hypothetical protein
MPISKLEAVKRYFSVPEHPVTNQELLSFIKADRAGFDELAHGAAKELGETLSEA